jgi:mannose-6-phosphate isomerase-like protein (cupin superfamily)
MFIRELHDCEEFTAGDNCRLREILQPRKEELSLRYSLAHAVVKPGDTTWLHRLKTSEVYYIIEGEGIMHIDDESAPVRPGSTVYIPPRAKQCITNSGTKDLTFICLVDPAWQKEDEEVL